MIMITDDNDDRGGGGGGHRRCSSNRIRTEDFAQTEEVHLHGSSLWGTLSRRGLNLIKLH